MAQVVRSRAEILALASSPLAAAPPPNWAALAPTLPSVIVRGRVGDQGDQGDQAATARARGSSSSLPLRHA